MARTQDPDPATSPSPGEPPAGAAAEEARYDWREFSRTPNAVPMGDDPPATSAEVGGAVALAWQSGAPAATATEGRIPQRFTAAELAGLIRAFRAYTPPAPGAAPRAPAGTLGAIVRRQLAAQRFARRPEGGPW